MMKLVAMVWSTEERNVVLIPSLALREALVTKSGLSVGSVDCPVAFNNQQTERSVAAVL